jgi:hypothetical protein
MFTQLVFAALSALAGLSAIEAAPAVNNGFLNVNGKAVPIKTADGTLQSASLLYKKYGDDWAACFYDDARFVNRFTTLPFCLRAGESQAGVPSFASDNGMPPNIDVASATGWIRSVVVNKGRSARLCLDEWTGANATQFNNVCIEITNGKPWAVGIPGSFSSPGFLSPWHASPSIIIIP